jgi:hypothetical protein
MISDKQYAMSYKPSAIVNLLSAFFLHFNFTLFTIHH